jgi:hypothetical protein
MKLPNGQVFNSMLPDSATRLKVCKQVSGILYRGNGATGQQPSCTLPPTATFYRAVFLPSPPLIMILSLWVTFLIILLLQFGPEIGTRISESNVKPESPRKAAKVAASSGVFKWINIRQSYWW